jgi:SRSO17 transposase
VTQVHDASYLQRLDAFGEAFREDFRRRDQARWAAVYLQGLLLATEERKTIGTMARRVVLPADLVVEDVAQALQNFVNQSPWDERLILRRLRSRMAAAVAEEDGAIVIDEVAVAKQGRFSVGVQRQFSGILGRKTNCQVATVLYHYGAGGVWPLSLRLYLPKSWLGNDARLDSAGVPAEYRRPQTKAGIALELLDELRAEGWPSRIVVTGATDGDLLQALQERGLTCVAESEANQFTRSVRHPSPSEANAALISNDPIDDRLRHLWQGRHATRESGRSLLQDFGLEHFEGRSWRGFHHHASLVLLAYAFRSLDRLEVSRLATVR